MKRLSNVQKKRISGQIWWSNEVLASDGFAPVNEATLDTLRKVASQEKPIIFHNFSSQAYQFNEENVSEQVNSFSRFTAAGPSKRDILHAVLCTASDQSQKALEY